MPTQSPDILFLLPYPVGHAPSQRFRVEQLLPVLDEAGINYTLRPFMDEETWKVLYKGGSAAQKIKGILKGYLRRWKTVHTEAGKYDYIFIHREAAPLGPPVFEWWLKKIKKKKIIYDFDDAIWIPNTSAANKIAKWVKAFWKVPFICKWSYAISAGNDYLCYFSAQHTRGKIVKVPTVVDTEHRYNQLKQHHNNKPVVGWTGSHSTLRYLDDIVPALQQLQEKYNFSFAVIADKKPSLPLKDWLYIPWNPGTEIMDLLKIDIGLMPLTPDPWSEGKCGFKLIQYLSLGIPALASPVGVNTVIIEDNLNGYLCHTSEDWLRYIEKLLGDATLRAELGKKGRKKIADSYSILSVKKDFLGLFT